MTHCSLYFFYNFIDPGYQIKLYSVTNSLPYFIVIVVQTKLPYFLGHYISVTISQGRFCSLFSLLLYV